MIRVAFEPSAYAENRGKRYPYFLVYPLFCSPSMSFQPLAFGERVLDAKRQDLWDFRDLEAFERLALLTNEKSSDLTSSSKCHEFITRFPGESDTHGWYVDDAFWIQACMFGEIWHGNVHGANHLYAKLQEVEALVGIDRYDDGDNPFLECREVMGLLITNGPSATVSLLNTWKETKLERLELTSYCEKQV